VSCNGCTSWLLAAISNAAVGQMVRNRHVSVRYRTVPHTASWLRNIIPTGLNHVTNYHVTSGDSFILKRAVAQDRGIGESIIRTIRGYITKSVILESIDTLTIE